MFVGLKRETVALSLAKKNGVHFDDDYVPFNLPGRILMIDEFSRFSHAPLMRVHADAVNNGLNWADEYYWAYWG